MKRTSFQNGFRSACNSRRVPSAGHRTSAAFFKNAYHAEAFEIASGLLGLLRAVKTSALTTIGHAGSIKRTANDMIANAGQVLDTAAADQDNRVLLKVVADAGDVCRTFFKVGQAHTGNFPKCGIGLFGRHRTDCKAHAALLGALLQDRHVGLVDDLFSALADQLVNSGHARSTSLG